MDRATHLYPQFTPTWQYHSNGQWDQPNHEPWVLLEYVEDEKLSFTWIYVSREYICLADFRI